MAMRIKGRNVVIHAEIHSYCSHPSIGYLGRGELIVACNRSVRTENNLHPPEFPGFHNLILRSLDCGESWGKPQVLPNYDWYGVECPGITVTRSGRVFVNQYRFLWLPLELARKRQRESGEEYQVAVAPRRFTVPRTDQDWENAVYPWARGHGGTWIQASDDGGRTWDSIEVDVRPFQGGYSNHGGVELDNGVMVLGLNARPGGEGSAFVVFSRNGGRSWGEAVKTAQDVQEGAAEPSLATLGNGRLVMVARTKGGWVWQCGSEDGGRTWGAYRRTGMYGLPAHLLKLKDGRVLCTYGRREAPFGIRGCVSGNGGKSWETEGELVIRDDMKNGNLGYPTTVELEDGRLLCVYYGENDEGVTCIQGTFFSL